MIRFGDAKSTAGLKKLWKECFADEDAYIDAFFEALYGDRNVLIAEENGVLMGASFFLPGKLYLENSPRAHRDGGGFLDIRYVYALAVYPQYRRRGVAGKLLRFAYEAYQAPLIAEPAEEGLVGGFYEPHGFAPAFYLNKETVKLPQYSVRAAGLGIQHLQESVTGMLDAPGLGDKDMPEPGDCQICFGDAIGDYYIRPADVAGYCHIRDAYFLKHGYVSWPERHIAFAIQEHRANGGEAFILTRDVEIGIEAENHKVLKTKKLITPNPSGNIYEDLMKNKREDIVLYYVEGRQIVVTETTLKEQEATDFFALLMPECSTLLFTSGTGQSIPTQHGGRNPGCCLNGMAFGLPPLCGYLNLSLD